MALEIKAGETYPVDNPKNGESWSLFRVKAEKGRKEITVFLDHNAELKTGDRVAIESINAVRYSARKGRDDKWYDSVTVNASGAVETAGAGAFNEINESDGELPF